jgi:hypothetical protein
MALREGPLGVGLVVPVSAADSVFGWWLVMWFLGEVEGRGRTSSCAFSFFFGSFDGCFFGAFYALSFALSHLELMRWKIGEKICVWVLREVEVARREKLDWVRENYLGDALISARLGFFKWKAATPPIEPWKLN